MYREITAQLEKWKDNPRRKPLLVTGVRQCGKTYTIQDFGVNNFDSFITINFESQPAFSSVFEYDLNISRIIRELEQLTNQPIVTGKTLLFFDEIQACPRAITSLKYFCESNRELHVIAAGSLLGVALTHEQISFPVGKVNRMQLYPMNFREFAIANGKGNMIQLLADWPLDREIPQAYCAPMKKLLKDYYIVGGMPEVVETWIDANNYEEVENVQDEILRDYEDDFGKYAPASELPKIRMIWNSVPVQLAKDNNKFVFSHVAAGKRAADLEDAMERMVDAGLIYQLNLAANPEIPLSAGADKTYFKVYMADIGLLRAKSKISPDTIIQEGVNYSRYKGALAENYVYTELISSGRNPYFWRSGNTAELDFLFDGKNTIVPVEVKAADNMQAKSYRLFCRKYQPEVGFKLSLKNIGEKMCEHTRTINLPLYMAWNIDRYL